MVLDAFSDAAGQLMEGLFLKLQICSLRILKCWQTTWALHRCSYTTKNHSEVTKIMFSVAWAVVVAIYMSSLHIPAGTGSVWGMVSGLKGGA